MEEHLAAGIAAARKGDREMAAVHLSWAVQSDPNSEQAWLWLARNSDDIHRRIYCFGKVLSINPHNREARREYRRMGIARPESSQPKDNYFGGSRSGPSIFKTSFAGLVLFGLVSGLLFSTGMVEPPRQALRQLSNFILPVTGYFNSQAGGIILKSPGAAVPVADNSLSDKYEIRFRRAYADIQQAEAKMQENDFVGAIQSWDKVIAVLPEYSAAYYKRAASYQGLASRQKVQSVYWGNLEKARADLDQAIALGYQDGEAFFLRYQVLAQSAGMYEIRSEREYLYQLALENLEYAREAGSLPVASEGLIAQTYYNLQQCSEGLAEVQALRTGSTGLTPAAQDQLEAQGRLCQGDYEKALSLLRSSLEVEPNSEGEWLLAVVLYNSNQKDEALEVLNRLLAAHPREKGEWYYLRALVNYERDQKAEAANDLQTGAALSWNHAGLRSYVLGRLFQEQAEHSLAVSLLQDALVTVDWYFFPLYPQIEGELAALGEGPLLPVTSLPFQATPMPGR